jgi:hypothetical protein
MARPRSELTHFILSLPTTVPVREVVAKAKERGMATSETNVHRVRKLQKSGKATGGKKSAKVAAPSQAKANGTHAPGSTQSVAEFVRSVPASVPVKDVVRQAKAAGLKLSRNYVYRVRAGSKSSGPKRRVGRPAGVKNAVSVHVPVHAPKSSVEELLRAVAAEIGLGRSIEILQSERAKVRAVFGN